MKAKFKGLWAKSTSDRANVSQEYRNQISWIFVRGKELDEEMDNRQNSLLPPSIALYHGGMRGTSRVVVVEPGATSFFLKVKPNMRL
jgi:hypothetical protein